MVDHRGVTTPVVTPTARGPRVVGVITRRDATGALTLWAAPRTSRPTTCVTPRVREVVDAEIARRLAFRKEPVRSEPGGGLPRRRA
jgi:hypothetical protein